MAVASTPLCWSNVSPGPPSLTWTSTPGQPRILGQVFAMEAHGLEFKSSPDPFSVGRRLTDPLPASVCPPENAGWRCSLPRVGRGLSEVENSGLSTSLKHHQLGQQTPGSLFSWDGVLRDCRGTEDEQLMVLEPGSPESPLYTQPSFLSPTAPCTRGSYPTLQRPGNQGSQTLAEGHSAKKWHI